jgi:hypothetical protein
MKKIISMIFVCFVLLVTLLPVKITAEEQRTFSLQNKVMQAKEYTIEYLKEDINVCSTSSVKTYMDYRAIKSRDSKQYKYINENMTVNELTGLLEDDDGFIGIALGSYFGEIGEKYIFTLDTGKELKFVKVEAKSDNHTINGCYHSVDNSVIEFVVNTTITKEYFNSTGKYILNGNFNNTEEFAGKISSIVKILGTIEVEVVQPVEIEENPLSISNFFYDNQNILSLDNIN